MLLQLFAATLPFPAVATIAIRDTAQLRRTNAMSHAYRALFEFLAYTGLHIGEALGLRWCNVDVEAVVLRVRQHLSRHRTPKHLKTTAAWRGGARPRRDATPARALARLVL